MRVLIIDDSRAMRLLVRRQLKEIGLVAAEYFEAADGAQGFDAIKELQPDLVLSGWNMPVMSGIEMLEALNAEGISVRLGFVTAESNPRCKDRAMEAGALFIVAKPFNAHTFRRALGQYV
jgi:two-component system chemotaxis response regulator CheY